VVIRAAYRALAQRYHPDRWTGNPVFAHQRTAEINIAYSVLGDKEKRDAYDKQQDESSQHAYKPEESEEFTQAFDSAILQLEERWGIACQIYGDLPVIRKNLRTISHVLEFSYITLLLETRAFSRRVSIATELERRFLERFFGTNNEIINYARDLIFTNQRGAAKELNRLIEVVGSDVDPKLVIEKLDAQFFLKDHWAKFTLERQRRAKIVYLSQRLRSSGGDYFAAAALAEALEYKLDEVSAAFFKSPEVHLYKSNAPVQKFANREVFLAWARNSLI